MHAIFWLENLKGRDPSEELGIDGKLRGNRVEGCGLDSSGSGQGPVINLCKHGNETLGPTKVENFLSS